MTVVRLEKGAPEVATGWYLTAAWLLGLPVFTDISKSDSSAVFVAHDMQKFFVKRSIWCILSCKIVTIPTTPVSKYFQ